MDNVKEETTGTLGAQREPRVTLPFTEFYVNCIRSNRTFVADLGIESFSERPTLDSRYQSLHLLIPKSSLKTCHTVVELARNGF
jgi:hypothetical protein